MEKYVRCRACDSKIDIADVGVAHVDNKAAVFECIVCGNDDMSKVFVDNDIKTDLSEQDIKELFEGYERAIGRYIEAENFLMQTARLPWYKRLFVRSKINSYLLKVLEKYEN